MSATARPTRCLVTGATGYIGGRLAPRLVAAGNPTRVLARTPKKLDNVPWADEVEIVQGDLDDLDSLRPAFENIDVVFYLVHSMGSGGSFAEAERRSAQNVARAAAQAGIEQIVYLGGLHPPDGELSEHLRSRTEVGQILLESQTPALIFQAGTVIGSGSASFEMTRHLTNRLPVMTTPRWVRNRIQPIAIRDVLHYLVAAAELSETANRSYDIGGPDVLTYEQMMKVYAEVAGLRTRHVLVAPVLTPRLASLWIGLVTPLPRALAGPLIESVACEAIAHERDIDQLIAPPEGGTTGYAEAVRLALRHAESGSPEPDWSETTDPADPLPNDPAWAGVRTHHDEIRIDCAASTEQVRRAIADVASARGWTDRAEHGSRLRYRRPAPGRLVVEFQLADRYGGRTEVRQRELFVPRGTGGQLWWALRGPRRSRRAAELLREIRKRAEAYDAPNRRVVNT